MRTHLRPWLGLALAGLFAARSASATTILETGDNGSEQMGRGGAWVARASDPLAAFYNPAGLAGQETKLTLQANFNLQQTCFTRIKAANDTSVGDGANGTVAPGTAFPQVCNQTNAFPDPQIAFTYKVTPTLGIGFAIVGPSAAGQQNWPAFQGDGVTPSAQRYLLLSANTLLLTPTLGVGWEPIDHLRVGASFLWGIANLDFATMSWASNSGGNGQNPAINDIKGELKASQGFIPGFTGGVIWSPTDNLDVAGWYKFMSSIDTRGDVNTAVGTGKHVVTGNTALSDCGGASSGVQPGTCAPGDAHIKITIPMEAKLGLRFHVPRSGVEPSHKRDPLAQDLFDVEADLTWANDSAFKEIGLSFPGSPSGLGVLPANGTPGLLPPDASIPHNFKDVLGVRLGGDVNVIPSRLAVRAGTYFESQAQSAQWQNIDFAGEWRFGLALGATLRLLERLDLMAGFGHTFIGTSSYSGPNGLPALTGAPCNLQVPGNSFSGGTQCSDGTKAYRTEWAVNLGTITNSFNQINLGASYRF